MKTVTASFNTTKTNDRNVSVIEVSQQEMTETSQQEMTETSQQEMTETSPKKSVECTRSPWPTNV